MWPSPHGSPSCASRRRAPRTASPPATVLLRQASHSLIRYAIVDRCPNPPVIQVRVCTLLALEQRHDANPPPVAMRSPSIDRGVLHRADQSADGHRAGRSYPVVWDEIPAKRQASLEPGSGPRGRTGTRFDTPNDLPRVGLRRRTDSSSERGTDRPDSERCFRRQEGVSSCAPARRPRQRLKRTGCAPALAFRRKRGRPLIRLLAPGSVSSNPRPRAHRVRRLRPSPLSVEEQRARPARSVRRAFRASQRRGRAQTRPRRNRWRALADRLRCRLPSMLRDPRAQLGTRRFAGAA
jgi:hypothetical protein